MNYPYDQIEKVLVDFSWDIVERVVPESKEKWYIKEIWKLNKFDSTTFLNFLIDPQTMKEENSIWAISFTDLSPKSRLEAEQGELITVNKNLLANLKMKLETSYNKRDS